jgi:hypothetical protein
MMDVIDELIAHCEAWEPWARVMGNVCAGDAAQALRSLRAENAVLQHELTKGIHTCGPNRDYNARLIAAAPDWDAMQEAIGAGDGTLHGAIEYWHEEALRLRAEVANRNQRALDGDKAKAAFDNVFDENERLRAEVQHLRTGWITLQIDIGDLIPAIDGERANDPMINRVKRVVTELTEAKEALRLCVDVIQHISYAWQGQGTHPQTAINAAMRLYEKEGK